MAMKRFRLDRRNRKLAGVCAGIARHFGIDPTLVRVGVVAVTILGAFPWTLLAYAAAILVARPSRDWDDEEDYRSRGSTKDLRLNERDIDRRMAEVDAYVAGANGSLAREIEKLR